MKHRYVFLAAPAVAILLVAAVSQGEPLSLTLPEALRQAAERNLDVRAQLYSPAIAEAEIRRALGIYDTRLAVDTLYSRTEPATISQGILTGFRPQDNATFDASVKRLLSSGGTVSLGLSNSWQDTHIPVVDVIDPNTNLPIGRTVRRTFGSDLSVKLSQPLLKNFGREYTEIGIEIARADHTGSLAQFRSRLSDIVARTRNEYFRLYNVQEDLEVKKTSLALAQKILSETRARVAAGVLPAMEILNAEFGVASREKEVIDAERVVNDQRDVLRALLQAETSELLTVDRPEEGKKELDEKGAVRTALDARPELQELRASIRAAELAARSARNLIRPDLNLTAGAGFAGFSDSYGEVLGQIGSADHPVWTVGLSFGIPLGNSEARNEYLKNKLREEQLRTQLRSQEDAITNEVRAAVRAVNSTYKQLEVADRGRSFAEERLRSFIRRNEVGLATTRDVLDVENDLAIAKSNQIAARTAYDTALTQFRRVTGRLLEDERITLNGRKIDLPAY